MGKKEDKIKSDIKTVKSVNKNVRSSTRKLKPILKSIVGKKVGEAIRDLTFSEKRISKDVKKTISSAVATLKTISNMILISYLLKKHTVENKL